MPLCLLAVTPDVNRVGAFRRGHHFARVSYTPAMFGRKDRRAAAAAVAGGALALGLTPPMASVWAYDPPSTPWASMHWVERMSGPTLEAWGALSFQWWGLDPYQVYGKGFFLVYAAMAPILRLVHQRYATLDDTSRWERRTWRVMWFSVLVCAVADFASYWGISIPGAPGEVFWGGGFLVEMIASAALLASATMYGALSMRLEIVPQLTSLCLVAVIPCALVMLGIVVEYIPNGYVVPLSLTWAAYGVTLLLSPEEPPTQVEAGNALSPDVGGRR